MAEAGKLEDRKGLPFVTWESLALSSKLARDQADHQTSRPK